MFINDFEMQDTNAFYLQDDPFADQKLAYGIKDENLNNFGECFS